MEESRILEIIASGESVKTEFKASFGKDALVSLAAFSNTEGGRLFIGVDDKGNIKGVSLTPETIQSWINEVKAKTIPSIIPDARIYPIQNKNIVVMTVPEYPVKPVAFSGRYYKRKGNSNHLMGPEEIANEHLSTVNSSWDFYPDTAHTVSDVALHKVDAFIRIVERRNGTSVGVKPLEFLTKLKVIRRGSLTIGGYLLFADGICPLSDIQLARVKGNSEIIDSLHLNADLFTEVDECLAFIRKNLKVEYQFTGDAERIERYEYPLDAIREVVVNMVVHRDYRESSHSIIKIFDDRIEFFNPGKLFGVLSVNDLIEDSYTSQIRNKLISFIFREAGLIERYGTGIRRIINSCANHGLPFPLFEEFLNGFRVTLFKTGERVGERVGEKVGERVGETIALSKNQRRIIELILKNNRISARNLAIEIGISQRKIESNIRMLRKYGILIRTGPARGGYWIIKSYS